MKFMNDSDLAWAARVAEREEFDVMLECVDIVDRLRQWADRNSDGWAHWPAPVRAARQMIELIESKQEALRDSRNRNQQDITCEQRDRALRPIKSFLTRSKASAEERRHIIQGVPA